MWSRTRSIAPPARGAMLTRRRLKYMYSTVQYCTVQQALCAARSTSQLSGRKYPPSIFNPHGFFPFSRKIIFLEIYSRLSDRKDCTVLYCTVQDQVDTRITTTSIGTLTGFAAAPFPYAR
jgi:hypothetical protein